MKFGAELLLHERRRWESKNLQVARRCNGGAPPARPPQGRLFAILFPLKVRDKCSRLTTSYLPKRDLRVGGGGSSEKESFAAEGMTNCD